MTSAYILIAAVLLLGGVLAILGDRLGSTVGKSRLRLFKLRPRQTAIAATFLTGVSIAATTLGILFATSQSLRQGVFRLDEILAKRRQAQRELEQARDKLQKLEERQQTTNRDYQQAQSKLDRTSKQLDKLQSQVASLRSERQSLVAERDRLANKIESLDGKLKQREQKIAQQQQKLEASRNRLQELQGRQEQLKAQIEQREQKIAQQQQKLQSTRDRLQALREQQQQLKAQIEQRDNKIAQLDEQIAQKNETLKQRQARLQDLQQELSLLQKRASRFRQEYQTLRRGDVVLPKDRVLASAITRIEKSSDAQQIVDKLLQEANKRAYRATRPNNNQVDERVIAITKAQVKNLRQKISDGREYVLQIRSDGNYVMGEDKVGVFTIVAPNKQIFGAGEAISTVSIDTEQMGRSQLQNRLDRLLSAAKFRARRSGILGDVRVETGTLALTNFFERLNQASAGQFDRIQAQAAQPAETAGPLELKLVALKDGKVVFSSSELGTNSPQAS